MRSSNLNYTYADGEKGNESEYTTPSVLMEDYVNNFIKCTDDFNFYYHTNCLIEWMERYPDKNFEEFLFCNDMSSKYAQLIKNNNDCVELLVYLISEVWVRMSNNSQYQASIWKSGLIDELIIKCRLSEEFNSKELEIWGKFILLTTNLILCHN